MEAAVPFKGTHFRTAGLTLVGSTRARDCVPRVIVEARLLEKIELSQLRDWAGPFGTSTQATLDAAQQRILAF